MDLCESVSRATSRFFGVPVTCNVTYDGALAFEVFSSVFEGRKGVRLLIRRPFKNELVANAQFDIFGAHLIQVWKKAEDATVLSALNYLDCFSSKLSIDLRINGERIDFDESSIDAIHSLTTPGSFSMRVKKRIDSEVDECSLFEIIQCAYGFLLILSGVLSDSSNQQDEDVAVEGRLRQSSITRYERSARNRALCIAANGTTCAVCGFDFAKHYGAFAAGYIEVHHKQPLSTIGHSHSVDPIKDLVPLCPNCHAAVHMKNPPISPEELRAIVANQSGDTNEDS